MTTDQTTKADESYASVVFALFVLLAMSFGFGVYTGADWERGKAASAGVGRWVMRGGEWKFEYGGKP